MQDDVYTKNYIILMERFLQFFFLCPNWISPKKRQSDRVEKKDTSRFLACVTIPVIFLTDLAYGYIIHFRFFSMTPEKKNCVYFLTSRVTGEEKNTKQKKNYVKSSYHHITRRTQYKQKNIGINIFFRGIWERRSGREQTRAKWTQWSKRE